MKVLILRTFAALINARVILQSPYSQSNPRGPQTAWRVVGFTHANGFTLESMNTPERRRHVTDADTLKSLIENGALALDLGSSEDR
jgi:hypothetical protein